MAKPGDHPEFFRFPAPAGRSRESTIELDAEGRFWHDGARIEKPAMQRAFSQWIDRHPDDDRYILQNGYDWTYFTVKDVPFFVTGMRERAHELPEITLSDDSREILDPETLSVDRRGALYCKVKSGRFEARFTPSLQNALGYHLVENEKGDILFSATDRTWPIGTRQR